MKRILTFVLISMFLLTACSTTEADHGHADGTGVEAHDPWIRATLKDGNGAVYLLLHNHSTEEDALIGASSDVATTVDLHLTEMNADGMMEMIPQESVTLPSDAEVQFEPGGYHISLNGLKKDINIGDEITVVLHFHHHEDITLTVPVLDAASSDHDHMNSTP